MSKKIFLLFSTICILLFCISCDTNFKKLFSKQTAREKYYDQLKKKSSVTSEAWAATGKFALLHALEIPAPYAETGFFSGRFTDAIAFRFIAKGGQAVTVKLQRSSKSNITAFIDLWDGADTSSLDLLESADTTHYEIVHSSTKDESYILRLQPAARDTGSYIFTVSLAPILNFPIATDTKSNIGSYWGVDRDGGDRSHEGIDIFAKKGSNALAVADGYISRTGENNLGGKVVWLRPEKKNFSVYYAHLDSQLVRPGQFVKAGDPVGWVGNTGNARNTPAHLHFGIYTRNGAVDPLAFVQKVTSPELPDSSSLNETYLANSKMTLYPMPEKKNGFTALKSDTIRTEAFTGNYYRIILPDTTRAFIPAAKLNAKMKL